MSIELLEELENASVIWNTWLDSGYNPTKPLEIDFDFYGTKKTKSYEFYNFLKEEVDPDTTIESQRSLLIFKGYCIRIKLENIWTLEDFKSIIVYLTNKAKEYNCIMEGYGALKSDKNK